MTALTRKKKLDLILEENIGRWMTAREMLRKIGKRWKVSGFSSPRSVGLFLRRYKFNKKDEEYYIEKEKIEQSKYGPYGNKENR